MLESFTQDLLSAGAVEETSSLMFQGPLFSVPKKDSDKRRVILDLSALNKSILCPSFKMTTLQEVRRVLPLGAFSTSIDLKDAYWHIPVHPYYRKFLGFSIGGKKYRFRAMPFGLNVAPRIFTKLCRPILQELRRRGVNLLVYLDDWLVWGDSVVQCQEFTRIVLLTLERRGFIVNYRKSRLVPAQNFVWLGVNWDTLSGTLSMPESKVTSLTRDLSSFTRKPLISRRQLEQMLGRLQFAAVVDPVGKALLKNANHFLRPLARRFLRDRVLPFPKSLRKTLRRWLRPGVLASTLHFRPPPPSWDVYTDASLQGWGVHSSEGHHLRGTWSVGMKGFHINILELVGVYLALRKLPIPHHSHVRVHSDNSTVVCCLNRMGSARSRPLNSWVISILQLLEKRRLFLSAFHISGVRNVIADGLSRSLPISTEWMLDKSSFKWILGRAPTPQVDLFATRENAQLPSFVSPVLDVKAVEVDALSIPWDRWRVVYLFPPTPLILKVLAHLETFKGTALLVTPDWPGQAWFPLLRRKARECLHLPDPRLSQIVAGERVFCSSRALLRLLCWIL